MIRPLFTGGGGTGMALFARAYPAASFADADPEGAVSGVEPIKQIPIASSPYYIPCVALAMGDATLLVPGVDDELPVLESLRRAPYYRDVLMPDQRYVTVMLDKMGSMKWLASNGIPVPHTIIAKPRQGRGSEGMYVEQEHLRGQEYSVTMSANRNRELCAIVPVKILAKRRITIHGVTEKHPDVIRACQTIHEAIPAAGVVNIQGSFTEDRGFLPFEINPRISTTTGLAVLAGVDVLANWYAEAPKELQDWKEGLTLRRYWQNVVT